MTPGSPDKAAQRTWEHTLSMQEKVGVSEFCPTGFCAPSCSHFPGMGNPGNHAGAWKNPSSQLQEREGEMRWGGCGSRGVARAYRVPRLGWGWAHRDGHFLIHKPFVSTENLLRKYASVAEVLEPLWTQLSQQLLIQGSLGWGFHLKLLAGLCICAVPLPLTFNSPGHQLHSRESDSCLHLL